MGELDIIGSVSNGLLGFAQSGLDLLSQKKKSELALKLANITASTTASQSEKAAEIARLNAEVQQEALAAQQKSEQNLLIGAIVVVALMAITAIIIFKRK